MDIYVVNSIIHVPICENYVFPYLLQIEHFSLSSSLSEIKIVLRRLKSHPRFQGNHYHKVGVCDSHVYFKLLNIYSLKQYTLLFVFNTFKQMRSHGI